MDFAGQAAIRLPPGGDRDRLSGTVEKLGQGNTALGIWRPHTGDLGRGQTPERVNLAMPAHPEFLFDPSIGWSFYNRLGRPRVERTIRRSAPAGLCRQRESDQAG